MLRKRFLSTTSPYSSVAISDPFELGQNNAAVVGITVFNVSGTPALVVNLDGSTDGSVWKSIVASTATSQFGYGEAPTSGITYPMLRVRATITGATSSALFDVSVGLVQL